jgi:hypothetical protein
MTDKIGEDWSESEANLPREDWFVDVNVEWSDPADHDPSGGGQPPGRGRDSMPVRLGNLFILTTYRTRSRLMTRPLEKPRNMVRIQIEVTEEFAARLANLRKLCGFETQKDLFNNAFTVLNWAVTEVRKGNAIASVSRDRKHYDVLRTPALDHAAASPIAAISISESNS